MSSLFVTIFFIGSPLRQFLELRGHFGSVASRVSSRSIRSIYQKQTLRQEEAFQEGNTNYLSSPSRRLCALSMSLRSRGACCAELATIWPNKLVSSWMSS